MTPARTREEQDLHTMYQMLRRLANPEKSKAYALARYHAHPEKAEAYRTKYRNSLYGRATMLLIMARRRAKEKMIECSLNHAWILPKLEFGRCEETGIKLDMTTVGGLDGKTFADHRAAFIPSLDLVDPDGGYTPANTKLVCWIYNRAKGPYTKKTLVKMAKGLLQLC